MSRRQKISCVARRMRWCATATTILGPLVTAAALVGLPTNRVVASVLATDGLPFRWAAGIMIVETALIVMALLELIGMMRQVEADAPFSMASIGHLRRFSGWLVTAVLASLVLDPACRLLLLHGEGGGAATLTFDGSSLLALFVSTIFFLIVRLLEIAARYQDDSRSIV